MLTFETHSIDRRSPTLTVDRERRVLSEALAKNIKQTVLYTFGRKLRDLVVTDEMKRAYPFLANKQKLIKDFSFFMKISTTENRKRHEVTATLQIEPRHLAEQGYPKNLVSLLEYGSSFMPPLAFIRSLKSDIHSFLFQGTKKVMLECASS